jgi:hypothetical protein
MTVESRWTAARLLAEQLSQASPDLLRELLATFINMLLSAEGTWCAAQSTAPSVGSGRTGATDTGRPRLDGEPVPSDRLVTAAAVELGQAT